MKLLPCKKSRIICFTSSRLKKIVVFPSQSRFLVTLIFCIALGSASNACCYLKCISINFILSCNQPVCNDLPDQQQFFLGILVSCYVIFNSLIENVFTIHHNVVVSYVYRMKKISHTSCPMCIIFEG